MFALKGCNHARQEEERWKKKSKKQTDLNRCHGGSSAHLSHGMKSLVFDQLHDGSHGSFDHSSEQFAQICQNNQDQRNAKESVHNAKHFAVRRFGENVSIA